ncbi:hypothetical protein DXG01_002770 [Tephrocybe rancida]|nr:hypothetical protein DXG01_002770 [Tephrocybe rancida]
MKIARYTELPQYSMPGEFPGHGVIGRDLPPSPPPLIQALPAEVMIAIFSLALQLDTTPLYRDFEPDRPPNYGPLSFTPGSTEPMRLSQVCSSWFSLIAQTPKYWSKIRVRCSHHLRQIKLLGVWLEWSGSNPLDITIESSDLRPIYKFRETKPWDGTHLEAFSLLTTQAYRWRNLSLCFSRVLPTVLQNLPVDCFKMLESADIRRPPIAPNWVDQLHTSRGLWDAIHNSPALLSVVWEREYLVFHLAQDRVAHLPWYKLTTLEITLMEVDLILRILPMCKNLEHLSLKGIQPPLIDHYEETHPAKGLYQFVLPRLESLILSGEIVLLDMIPRLVLPALDIFELDGFWITYNEAPWVVDAIKDLFDRSKCHLKSLTLGSTHYGFDGCSESLLDLLSSQTSPV